MQNGNIYIELLIHPKQKIWKQPELLVHFLTVSKESEIEDWFRNKIEEPIDFKLNNLYLLYMDPFKKGFSKVDKLFAAIQQATEITIEQIKGKRGKQEVVFARQCFHYMFMKQKLGSTTLAGVMTNNDHATVLYSVKIVEFEKDQKGWRSEWYEEINNIYFPIKTSE